LHEKGVRALFFSIAAKIIETREKRALTPFSVVSSRENGSDPFFGLFSGL